MVFDFFRHGRHQEFLSQLSAACAHLKSLLDIQGRNKYPFDSLASAISPSVAVRMHVHQDAKGLNSLYAELSRLHAHAKSALKEWSAIDPLDALEVASLLSRAKDSLAATIQGYDVVLKALGGGSPGIDYGAPPEAMPIIISMHANLSQAAGMLGRLEQAVKRLEDQKQRSSQSHRIEKDYSPFPSVEHTLIAQSPKEIRFEISSYFAKQWRHGEILRQDFHTALQKVEHFVALGNTPFIPSHAEPHCYGMAPDHLNGVVAGRQERLIYFVDDQPSGPVVKLCCWISDSMHKDAFSRLRHQNLYRRIMSKNPSMKVTRRHFSSFAPFDSRGAMK